MPHVLVIDNYDSFVYTIVSYLRQLGADVTVMRNNDPGLEPILTARAGSVPAGATRDSAVAAHDPAEAAGVPTRIDGVLVSPGPGHPQTAGRSLEMIGWCAEHRVPMLGVCLGHQALGEYFGAQVASAPSLRHGKTSTVRHQGAGIFDAVPSPFTATRYHSLAVLPETIPAELLVTATTEEGVVMGLQHHRLPLYGVQFHPESVLTEYGHLMVANWLTLTGAHNAVERSKKLAPLITAVATAR